MYKIISLLASFSLFLGCNAQFHNVKLGDILTIDGVKGIVFNVDDEGEHGQIMSVKAYRAKKDLFCLKSSYLKHLSMTNIDNGQINTDELFNYCNHNKISLSQFPVFEWCHSLGKGWYIPSIQQLKEFVNYWLGNKELTVEWEEDEEEEIPDSSIPHTKLVNDLLLEAGGIPFLNGVFSSTLDDKHKVDVFEYNKNDGKWKFKKINPMKTDRYCVGRAFYNF